MTKKEKNIKVLICKVGETPKIEVIENNLSNLQKLVSGRIEVVAIGESLMICNEEGKLDELPPNFITPHDVIVGDVLFVGDDGEEFGSLSDDEIFRLISYLISIGRCKINDFLEDDLLREIIEASVIFNVRSY